MKWVILLCSVIATAGALWAYQRDWFGMIGQELGAYDSGLTFWTHDETGWAPWAKTPTRSSHVVIVAIDDRTLLEMKRAEWSPKNYGSWPYARSVWAELIRFSSNTEARAVVLDLLMTEPKADDLSLQEAIENTRMPVFLGFDFDPYGVRLPTPTTPTAPYKKRAKGTETHWDTATLNHAAHTLSFPVRTQGLQLSMLPPAEAFDAKGRSLGQRPLLPQPPIEALWDDIDGFGMVQTESGEGVDNKMRSTRFAYTDGTNTYVTLAVSVMAKLEHASEVVLSPGRLQIGNKTWRINEDGSAGIPYDGTLQQQFQTISLMDVLYDAERIKRGEPSTLKKVFKDKIILVGGFAAGTSDLRSTPFENFTPGVVKHATEIETLLQGRWIVDAPFWVSVALAAVVALISVLVILILESEYLEILWPIALFFVSYFGPGCLLVYGRIHILSVLPSVAGTLASIAVTVCQQLVGGQARESFRAQFRHVMDPHLVDWLTEVQPIPNTHGEQRVMTVLVLDSSLFDVLHQQFAHDPKQLMYWLNQYYAVVTEAVVRHGGCVDQYLRGAVIALFGAPAPHKDHAEQAGKAAWEVLERIRTFRDSLQAAHGLSWHVHLAMHSGAMLVGNIGGHPTLSYTALGPEMDAALELAAQRIPNRSSVLISEATYNLLQGQLILRELPDSAANGTRVFELMGLTETTPHLLRNAVSLYEQALLAYRQHRWDDAWKLLSQACALAPDDPVAQDLYQRCQNLLTPEDTHAPHP